VIYNRENAGAAALERARQWTGHPYIFGGTIPQDGGTDCSGLWQWAYAGIGVGLARTTYDQFRQWQLPHGSKLEPGDLLFINGSDAVNGKPGHVMGYVSPGRVFQAAYTGVPIGEFSYPTSQYLFVTRPALALPVGPAPSEMTPTTTELAHLGLVKIPDPAANALAKKNGWVQFYFGLDRGFHPMHDGLPVGITTYANAGYVHPKPHA
jgi:cell wall-associated NlpC family hydrolase